MPRLCKICEEEFANAAKLAEHMKQSDCSNHVSCVSCPYCGRDDFVDVDSLNRHLSHNRRCSRADYAATDKLSILAPDLQGTKMSTNTTHSNGFNKTSSKQQYLSYVDDLEYVEGSLGNIANVLGLEAIQRQCTELHPDPGSLTFVVRLTDDCNSDGKPCKELVSVGKIPGDTTNELKILQKGPSVESEFTNVTGQDVEELSFAESHSAGDIAAEEEEIYRLTQTIDFEDADADDESVEAPDVLPRNNTFPPEAVDDETITNGENSTGRPIVKHFQGGSPQLDCLADLYTMLDKRGVANSLFDEIATWAWLNGPSFGRTPPMKRKTVVERVSQHVRGDNYRNYMLPKQKILKLSTGRHVAVTYFPLENMIKDLLCNTTLMRPDNLLISDIHNPCAHQCNNEAMAFGEVNSGNWWRTAQQHECTKDNDMLWPLMMFIDGMKVDNLSGKLRLEPITFTFSRFHRWVRNQPNAWRTWAYMDEVKEPVNSNTPGAINLTAKDRLQEYHDILRFLMSDLIKIQRRGMQWSLDLGTGLSHKVVLKMPLQFIIGDCEGHDKLVGRFKGHTMNIKGLCRDCDIPTQHSDDENWRCTYFMQHEMSQLSEEELRQFSFHAIDNGLRDVSVGGCPRGIRSLCNAELLHLYQSGHCEWIWDGFTHTLSANAVKETTTACSFFVNTNRGQSDRSFPPIGTFRDGLAKAAGVNLQAHEKHERVFFIYLLMCCSDFVGMLSDNMKRGYLYDVAFYKNFLKLLEHCLGFGKWASKREHDANTILGEDGTPDESVSQNSVRRYLSLLKAFCPRTELGKNFKMTKFHQSLHLTHGISNHGSLMNLDGRAPESMAKGIVKDPASHTQRVSSKLSYQTGKRYMESLTFREYKRLRVEHSHEPTEDTIGPGGYINNCTKEAQLARGLLTERIPDNNRTTVRASGTKFTLILDVDPGDHEFAIYIQWEGTGTKTIAKYSDSLLEKLARRLFDADDGGILEDDEVQGCTAVQVDGVTYEAHPFYRNDHPWHDWVYIKWDGYDDLYPARIDMFIDLRNATISNEGNRPPEDYDSIETEHAKNGFRHVFLEQKLYAVVWSTKAFQLPRHKVTEHHFPLQLADRIDLEPHRRIVPVDCFVKPCFGFLNTCGLHKNGFDGTAIIMKNRSVWANHFLS